MSEGQHYGELVPIGGGDAIPLIAEVMTIGRRQSCDICLNFQNISGSHCELSHKEGVWKWPSYGQYRYLVEAWKVGSGWRLRAPIDRSAWR
jgi:hypothetical protein